MDDLRSRLIVCFTAVFRGLTPDEAPNASVDTLPAWDSSNHFLLMQTVEETFGIQIPEEMLGEIDSFGGFERYLTQTSDRS